MRAKSVCCAVGLSWFLAATGTARAASWDEPDAPYLYFGPLVSYTGALGGGLQGMGYDARNFIPYWRVGVEFSGKPSISHLVDLAAAWNLTEVGPGHVQLGVIGGAYKLGDKPTPAGSVPPTVPDAAFGAAIGPEVAYHVALGPIRLRPALELEYGRAGVDPAVVKGWLIGARVHASYFIASHFMLFGDVGYSVVSMKGNDLELSTKKPQVRFGFAF